ncbi:MAG: hypothetical protein Q4P15_01085 [Propionibacteriaceae bacterium]|nr:hypothetical protein [Propionibacteriaceae bacterium]
MPHPLGAVLGAINPTPPADAVHVQWFWATRPQVAGRGSTGQVPPQFGMSDAVILTGADLVSGAVFLSSAVA